MRFWFSLGGMASEVRPESIIISSLFRSIFQQSLTVNKISLAAIAFTIMTQASCSPLLNHALLIWQQGEVPLFHPLGKKRNLQAMVISWHLNGRGITFYGYCSHSLPSIVHFTFFYSTPFTSHPEFFFYKYRAWSVMQDEGGCGNGKQLLFASEPWRNRELSTDSTV